MRDYIKQARKDKRRMAVNSSTMPSIDGYIISSVTDVWSGSLGTKVKSQTASVFANECFN